MVVPQFVKVEDLDRKFDNNTHPKLWQVKRYIERANKQLYSFAENNNISDTGNFNIVGIMLVENMIHNRKVKDGIAGYEYTKPEYLTAEMENMLFRVDFYTSKFSFDPGESNTGFI